MLLGMSHSFVFGINKGGTKTFLDLTSAACRYRYRTCTCKKASIFICVLSALVPGLFPSFSLAGDFDPRVAHMSDLTCSASSRVAGGSEMARGPKSSSTAGRSVVPVVEQPPRDVDGRPPGYSTCGAGAAEQPTTKKPHQTMSRSAHLDLSSPLTLPPCPSI
jgi:hypothetical protein